MKIHEIRKLPTSITAEDARACLSNGVSGFHESVLRSYHILQKVKDLLAKGTPSEITLEIIEEMERYTAARPQE